MNSGTVSVRLLAPLAASAVLVAAVAGVTACSGSSSDSAAANPATTGSATTPSAQTTDVSQVAHCRSVLSAGYQIDSAHSGSVSSTTYSAAADVQAALEYDQLKSGQRAVYLHRKAGRVDAVASCVTLTFGSAHNAQRFFGSYRQLRRDAGKLVTPVAIAGAVPAGTVGYREGEQSFAGYNIASTTVVEAAAVTGATLTIVSTADRLASAKTSGRLLAAAEGTA